LARFRLNNALRFLRWFCRQKEEIAVTYRSTAIYLLVVILFLGFYLFETRREEKQKRDAEAMKTIFAFQPDELTRLSLRRENQEIVLEKRHGGDWEITAPLRAPADPLALSRVKNTLGYLQYLRIISKDPRDLSEFGLDPANFVITYRIGDKEGSLAFGHKSPVEDGFYARTGTDRTVYLIWRPDKSDLEKSLFDLRNKSLFTLRRDQVERLVIERSGQAWTLHRIEEKWFLIGEESLPIDQEKMGDILRITLVAEALSFVQEEAGDLARYGLDHPEARLFFSGNDRTEEILYGAHSEERAVYAMIGGKPQVLSVPKRLLEDLLETIEDLKVKEKGSQSHEP
jgi:hypothetical protein